MYGDGYYCSYGESQLSISEAMVFAVEETSGSDSDGDTNTIIIITVTNPNSY